MTSHHIRVATLATLAALALLCFRGGYADEAPQSTPTCTIFPPTKGKTRQRFESTPLMTVAGELEAQGEVAFHLKFAAPTTECLIETFAVADMTVVATYNPLEKGPSTLNYRFAIHRPTGNSEILVLYSGLAALLANSGYVIHVSEEKDAVISWYAMFRDEPTYPSIKSVVMDIVGGNAKPLMAVRWPTGAKEGEIVAFDGKRLE